MTRAETLGLVCDRILRRTQQLADGLDAESVPLSRVRREEMRIEQAADIALVRAIARPMAERAA